MKSKMDPIIEVVEAYQFVSNKKVESTTKRRRSINNIK